MSIRSKPNVLIFMFDQMQSRVLESNNPCHTPHMDQLAAEGTRFRRAYTPNAVCSPARASLMTGLLPHNHGVLHVTHNVDEDQSCLRLDKPHWAQRFENAGYRTGYFGKWHIERSNLLEPFGWQVNGEMSNQLYKQKEQLALSACEQKMEYSLAKYVDDPEGYKSQLLYAVTNKLPEQRMMGISTAAALDFLNESIPQPNPWCCMISLSEPHDPFVCGQNAYEEYDVDAIDLPSNAHDTMEGRPSLYKIAARSWKSMTDRQKKEAMACYYASITEIDDQVGRILTKLKQSEQIENTIIVLTSDHGELLGAHGLYTKNISAAEEVYNIPMVISGPGIAKGIVSLARVGLHDLCPTLLELTGCEPIETLDSKSFAPLLYNPNLEVDYQTGFAEYHGGRILLTQRIVWNGNWKYVFNGFDENELYNLDEDPYEMNNLIDKSEYDHKLRLLIAQMWETIRITNDHSLYNSNYGSLRIAPYGPLI